MSDLNIHVIGSQLLREVLNCRFTMTEVSNLRGSHLQLKSCIMLGIKHATLIPRGVKERCLCSGC